MNPSRFQYDLFRASAPLSALVLLILLLASLRQARRRPLLVAVYAAFSVGTIIYIIANTLEICAGSPEASLFWSKLIYLGVGYLPILWYEFCVRFVHRGRGLPAPLIGLILLIPSATLVIVFSPALMGLMWSKISWMRQGPYYISLRSHGPWFYVHAAYTYSLFVAGAALLLRGIVLFRSYYRRQAASILAAISVCFALSALYVLRPIPGLVKDYTPIGYALAVMLFYYSLFKRDLFALAPMARGLVVERMKDGILVLDEGGRLADANPAAMRILGFGEERLRLPFVSLAASPAPGSELPPPSLPPELVEAARSRGIGRFSLGSGEEERWYVAEASSLDEAGSSWSGFLLIALHDETETHRLLSRVEALARTDELTGLPNRRSFLEAAAREISRAARHGAGLAVAMLDLDHFKKVNDSHGHQTGDKALALFGRILREELRGEDFVGRIGGEEFALVEVDADEEGARALCERIRQRLEGEKLSDEKGEAVSLTVSAGFALLDAERRGLDELLSAADVALYRAKAAGRNRVEGF